MEVFHSFQEITGCHAAVVALGTFDGVHMGHRAVMRAAMAEAKTLHRKAAVVTFSAHPLSVLHPEKEPLRLATTAQKIQYIADVGVDVLVLLPMTKELMAETPTAFCRQLQETFCPAAIVVGENFTYGAGAGGNTETLAAYMKKHRTPVQVLPLVPDPQGLEPISSTKIRKLIACGNVEEAGRLLGRPFAMTGTVADGDRRGRTIGFPTANLHLAPHMAVPADGVYITEVSRQGQWLPAMTNVGANPTFTRQYRRVETHILDWHEDIYGQDITVSFLRRIREEKQFSTVAALITQMQQDKEVVRQYFLTRQALQDLETVSL